MRLDKFLANSGVGTRSEVKRFIKDKRVKVNGEVVRSDSFNVNESQDLVLFDDLDISFFAHCGGSLQSLSSFSIGWNSSMNFKEGVSPPWIW